MGCIFEYDAVQFFIDFLNTFWGYLPGFVYILRKCFARYIRHEQIVISTNVGKGAEKLLFCSFPVTVTRPKRSESMGQKTIPVIPCGALLRGFCLTCAASGKRFSFSAYAPNSA